MEGWRDVGRLLETSHSHTPRDKLESWRYHFLSSHIFKQSLLSLLRGSVWPLICVVSVFYEIGFQVLSCLENTTALELATDVLLVHFPETSHIKSR